MKSNDTKFNDFYRKHNYFYEKQLIYESDSSFTNLRRRSKLVYIKLKQMNNIKK